VFIGGSNGFLVFLSSLLKKPLPVISVIEVIGPRQVPHGPAFGAFRPGWSPSCAVNGPITEITVDHRLNEVLPFHSNSGA
jgi:hypothetical protein